MRDIERKKQKKKMGKKKREKQPSKFPPNKIFVKSAYIRLSRTSSYKFVIRDVNDGGGMKQ